ncbi:MAG: insulinase family protein [Phototrophicales bacterium]|nr:MAG: insulinase family protein [Phototrophicales bacterium]RMG72916.1 MAG: insulinase family protein [Chloroflexota bacterium]
MFRQLTLQNGLNVILKEVHSTPVISSWLAYRVGSRNERTGQTGISHWVEHMMFKGTERYPTGVLDREIDRIGGQWNAFTSIDYTMYYETVPAEHIDLILDLEADRMVNALFDPDETESERTVIISERQGSENSPMFWLREEVRAAAFRVHGYHHAIIGDMVDLYTITRDELYAHYRQHYVPNNASLVLVGAFDTDVMIQKVERYFGAIPAGDSPKLFNRAEPEQQGERRVQVERPGTTAFLMLAYRAPAATQDDWFKLDLLDSILTGPGGELDNKTSRLYRALVKTEIAASVGGGLNQTIDPYLYGIVATVRDGRTLQETEAVLLEQIDRIIQDGVTEDELRKVKKQARAAFAYEHESVTNQGYWLAQSAILGDIYWHENYLARLDAVTVQDLQEAAARYLIARNRTVGWLIPTGLENVS